jgi:lysophospholipase L1-like esterase
MKTIVCFGDSIVEGEGDDLNLGGWVGRLAAKLGPHRGKGFEGFRVYNLGIGGDTIVNIFHRLGEVVIRKPDIVILGCVGNDVLSYLKDTRHNFPEYKISKYQAERGWHDTLTILTKLCPHVLVYGFYEVPEKEGGDRMIRYEDSLAHNAFIEKTCEQYGVCYMSAVVEIGQEGNVSHGSHPNAKGYDILTEAIHTKLTELGWLS